MLMTKDQFGHPAAIPETKDLALMIKALQCYSNHLDSPETEAEAYYVDALCTTLQFWLLSRELEILSVPDAVKRARQAFEKKTTQKEAA